MFEKLKANIVFEQLLKRRPIEKAYAMVGPEDSWYDTITTVHNSLAKIRQLPCENWEIKSHDGLSLKAVYYPGETNKTVIWVHGYTSHAERESAFPGLFYHSLGYNILIPYLRAHGPSEGKYLAFGSLECRDMEQWARKVSERMPDGEIVFHGLSMGGGIVLQLAAREIPNVKCMVADAPTIGIPQAFQAIISGTFKQGRDKILHYLYERFRREFSVRAEDYNYTENLKDGKYPLFLCAGSNENMEDNLALLRENNPCHTEVLILPGCNHGNGMYKQTEMYQSALREFLNGNTQQ